MQPEGSFVHGIRPDWPSPSVGILLGIVMKQDQAHEQHGRELGGGAGPALDEKYMRWLTFQIYPFVSCHHHVFPVEFIGPSK